MSLSIREINIVRNASILKGLEEQSFQRVLESAKVKKLGDGEYYFLAEQPATHAYILLDGKVKLAQVTTDGQQVILGYLVPGRVYGIIAILKKITYPVSAQAVGKCKALFWDQATLNHLMEASPRIALNSLRLMSGQIREFQNRVKDLSTKRVEQRIARAILRLARQSGKKVEEGVLIDLPLSRQDLAEMSGTTLYTVSRVFTEWERIGLTHSQRQKVTITNPHGLVVLAEDLLQVDQQAVVDVDDLCDL